MTTAPSDVALLLIIYAAVVVTDQLLKYWVANSLSTNAPDSAHLFDGWLSLTYVTNTGAAFGILAGSGSLFVLVPMLACAAVLIFWRSLSLQPFPVRAAIALMAAGATGNLIDRVRLGYVIDYIHLRYWPVFNLADCAVVVGVSTFVVLYVATPNKQERPTL